MGSYDYIAMIKGQNKGKILIVDDERFNCDTVMGLMMLLGVTNRYLLTKFVYNGEDAVKEIQQAIDENEPFRYGLILMDCNMPFLDGFEATKHIRQLFENHGIDRNK